MDLKKFSSVVADNLKDVGITEQMVDTAVNSTLNLVSKAWGIKTANEYINESQQNYLIVKWKSFSIKTLTTLLSGQIPQITVDMGRYVVEDRNREVLYTAEAKDTITDRDILSIYNDKQEKVASVKEHIISVGIPVIEKDVKKCSIYLNNRRLAVIKRSQSFGNVYFSVLDGDIRIENTNKKGLHIYCDKQELAILHDVPINFKDGYVDRLVVEYKDKNNEEMILALAIGIDLLGIR